MNFINTTLNYEECRYLLKSLDLVFYNALSSYIDIDNYIYKLSTHACFFLLSVNKDTVGGIAYYLNKDNMEIYISYLCVSKGCRKNGYGDTLLSAFCEYADNLKMAVRLEVRKNNVPAIHLYEKHGFIAFSQTENKQYMCRHYEYKK